MRRRLALGTSGYFGLATLYNWAAPLQIEWQLEDTLVSERKITDREWRTDQANQILHASANWIEHVDDTASHFVTHVRPHAASVIRAAHMLPGCRQHLKADASFGHVNQLSPLLDPQRKIFDEAPAAGSHRRTVQITSRSGERSRNTIRVTSFDQREHSLVLSGGRYAIGGRFSAHASADLSTHVAWPLSLAALDGSRLGGGNTMFLGADGGKAVRWGSPSATRRAAREAERAAREEEEDARDAERERAERAAAEAAAAERDAFVLEARLLLEAADGRRAAEAVSLLERAGVFAPDGAVATARGPCEGAALVAEAKLLFNDAERKWFAGSRARQRAQATALLSSAGVFKRAVEAEELRAASEHMATQEAKIDAEPARDAVLHGATFLPHVGKLLPADILPCA